MSPLLSKRGAEGGATLNFPWRFAEGTTYDPVNNKSGLISFSMAENRLSTEDAWNFVRNNVTFEAYNIRYDSADVDIPRFSRALAHHLNEYLKPHKAIKKDMVIISCSATAMHDLLAWSMAEPGEGILTSRPVYGRFEHDFGNKSQVKVVYADTDAKTCQEPDVVDEFERALARSEAEGVKIRGLIIVNPNNPLGAYRSMGNQA
jgi:1-aminocyclopropane-1-carboxylate synthase